MTVLAHRGLTDCQALPRSPEFAAWLRPGLLFRLAATLRLWRRRARERAELATLSERELRDMHACSADIWREITLPFWRASPPV